VLLLGGPRAGLSGSRRARLVEVRSRQQGAARAAHHHHNVLGILRACQRGLGIAMLPDYLVEE